MAAQAPKTSGNWNTRLKAAVAPSDRPITVSGLTNAKLYTCTVTATNSTASAADNPGGAAQRFYQVLLVQ